MGLPVASDFCAEASIEGQEPMLGTASPGTSVWFGVEVRGAWPRNAFDCTAVPDGVRARLAEWTAAIPGFRPQALRRPGCDETGDLAVVLALTDVGTNRVLRREASSIDAIAELDLAAAVVTARAGGVPEGWRESETAMVWVCVHGKRDRCCAKFGMPVFDAAEASDGIEAWQTSHLGGHRYAATLLCLPYGLCYGRVDAGDVAPMVRNHGQGRAHDLTLFRGRSCWSAPAQAAIHFVRAHIGEMALDGFAPESEVPADEGTKVRVVSPRGTFEVVVDKREVGGTAPPSCGKDLEPIRGWFQVALTTV